MPERCWIVETVDTGKPCTRDAVGPSQVNGKPTCGPCLNAETHILLIITHAEKIHNLTPDAKFPKVDVNLN